MSRFLTVFSLSGVDRQESKAYIASHFGVDHKQLTALTGIVAVMNILFFLLPPGAVLLLDFVHITS
jgi:hypothetical protein